MRHLLEFFSLGFKQLHFDKWSGNWQLRNWINCNEIYRSIYLYIRERSKKDGISLKGASWSLMPFYVFIWSADQASPSQRSCFRNWPPLVCGLVQIITNHFFRHWLKLGKISQDFVYYSNRKKLKESISFILYLAQEFACGCVNSAQIQI